jgi:RNA 2',3'-cyclic 3'-phosphodiesterase
MRAFITLELNRKTKEKIADIQSFIRKNSEKGRFKYIDNFHITLKFLGEVEENILASLYEELNGMLEGKGSLELSIDSLGAFGVGEITRTIYLSISGDLNRLIQIYDTINEASRNYKFKSDERFSPHITIAQEVKLKGSFEDLKKQIGRIQIGDLKFDSIVFMKSEQLSNKRIYTPLYKIELEKKF